MQIGYRPVRALLTAGVVGSGVFTAGCMSSPTYGTDKTANEQLVEDVSNILQPMPKPKPGIAYKPRPDLVRPASTRDLSLPQPQESVASVENPDWVESPEQQRARLRKEIAENDGKPGYVSPIAPDVVVSGAVDSNAAPYDEKGRLKPGELQRQGASTRAKIAAANQGNPTSRRFLSEPPLDYRVPAADAPVGDTGEDEWKKERRLKAASRKASGTKSWRDYIPGF